MIIKTSIRLGAGLLMSVMATQGFAAVASDIAGFAARRDILASANRLLVVPTIAPLPDDIVNLFDPVAFAQPDAEELAAIAAARAAEAAASAKSKPANDVELLGFIAERVMPS